MPRTNTKNNRFLEKKKKPDNPSKPTLDRSSLQHENDREEEEEGSWGS